MRFRWFFLVLFIMLLASFSTDTYAVSFSAGGVSLNKNVKTLKEIKRDHVVTQSLDISCGPAGLATLFNFYLGDNISEAEIINYLLNTVSLAKVRERNGFSLLDLKKFCQAKGYKVTGYKMDAEYLRSIKSPVLVPIKFRNYRHFVIVRGVVADRVFLADPTAGNVSMKLNKFNSIWTDGIGLVIEKKGAARGHNNSLLVKQNDFSSVANYQNIRDYINIDAIRTTTYPGEF